MKFTGPERPKINVTAQKEKSEAIGPSTVHRFSCEELMIGETAIGPHCSQRPHLASTSFLMPGASCINETSVNRTVNFEGKRPPGLIYDVQ